MPQTWLLPANCLSRAALAFACAVNASVIVCAVVIVYNYEEFSRSLTSWYIFIRGAILIIILAWVLTLPFVLLISRFNRWRFWFLAISGTLMGPALLIVINYGIRLAEPTQTFEIIEGWKTEMVVTAISLIATALYLGILRFSTRSDAL